MSSSARARRRQRGFVTAELAASLPAVMALLLAALFAVSAVTTQVRCVDAAREAALAAARGEPGGPAAARHAPDGADVRVSTGDDEVVAEVSVSVYPLGSVLPPVTVSGSATAAREPEGL
ncbi:MAG: TadE family type IV pilus minor pilin [Stackebrandtia sp.]